MTAREIAPALRTYRGELTNPARWATWDPRPGDILVCTPSKSGTTWTQSIIAHLLHGGTLPGPVPVISPWIDADLGDAGKVKARLSAQTGRRVVKTHSPGDGVPVWEGVHVVAVYRHPLDVFLSIRAHVANMAGRGDHPMKRPIGEALDYFLTHGVADDDIDRDCLALIVEHHARTVRAGRFPALSVLHYADMTADHRGAVAGLARALDIPADDALIDRVTDATAFGAMKARAAEFAPEGGTGFWSDDRAFFARGGTGHWAEVLSEPVVARYRARFAAILPDAALRSWLEDGNRAGP